MLFHYKALNAKKRIIEGDIDAQGMSEALAKIVGLGLQPLSLKPVEAEKGIKKLFGSKISLEDKVFLTRYLSLMLSVGTDLFRAINILIEDFEKPAVKNLLQEIRANLEKGKPFYSSFANYPKDFSPVFVSLIRAGEMSGNLEQVFRELSASLEKEKDLKSKIKSALTYPTILLCSSVIILILLVSFSLPKIANVFLSGGLQPPTFSKIIFDIGLFIGDHLIVLLTIFIVGIVGAILFFAKTLLGRRILYDVALRTPIIKTVIQRIALQRFSATFSSLLSSGLPIIEALKVTANSITLPEIREALLRIGNESIPQGLTIGEAFRQETVFPKIVSNLIAISEKSGHLEDILLTLSNFYTGEIESSIKSLVSFIEPVMLVIIGVIIGTIALAVIVPVYQLTSTF